MDKKTVTALVIVTVLVAGFFLIRTFTGEREPELIERIGPPQNDLGPADLLDTTLIDLFEVNESGRGGFATIDDYDNEVQVVIQLIGDSEVNRPANLRSGSCNSPGDIINDLNDVINGRSETMFSLSVDEITGGSSFMIAVFESESESETMIACGEK